jgi:serine/threonine protein kinase
MKLSRKARDQLFAGKSVEKISPSGRGKIGRVYKVTLDKGEILCVKILTKTHYTRNQDSNGWKLAYNHQNFDFKCYEDKQYFYFTIPYFKGELFHHASKYNLKSRFEIIKNLIIAARKIHGYGLIHRDLTCNNILVDQASRYAHEKFRPSCPRNLFALRDYY